MSMERWLNRLSFGARFLFHRRAADHELDEELQFHLDAKTEQNIAKGMAPEAARRAHCDGNLMRSGREDAVEGDID